MSVRAAERAVTKLLNDSEELKFIREECAQLSWQNTELGTQNQTYRRAIETLIETYYSADITDEVIENLKAVLENKVEICACGHLMTEHDQDGCCWIQCKSICGGSDATTE